MNTHVTPRAALLDLAERIDTGNAEKLPDASLVRLAGILRVEADRYPDEPAAQQPHTTHGRSTDQYVAALRAEVERLRLQAIGEPVTAELVGMPTLTVDQQLRVAALHTATAGRLPGDTMGETISEARVFEAYLRGEQA
jgi:hypothetical protein